MEVIPEEKSSPTIRVVVAAEDISDGKRQSCHHCPVAIALSRATGDKEAAVYMHDWQLRVEAWGRSVAAPRSVRAFVAAFDDRLEDDDQQPTPFEFDLPPFLGPEWEEACCNCGELFDPEKLDDEGVCPQCLTDFAKPEGGSANHG